MRICTANERRSEILVMICAANERRSEIFVMICTANERRSKILVMICAANERRSEILVMLCSANNVYLSRRVKYGRIVITERVVFDHRVQSLRGMPLVSLFTRARSYILLCAAGG